MLAEKVLSWHFASRLWLQNEIIHHSRRARVHQWLHQSSIYLSLSFFRWLARSIESSNAGESLFRRRNVFSIMARNVNAGRNSRACKRSTGAILRALNLNLIAAIFANRLAAARSCATKRAREREEKRCRSRSSSSGNNLVVIVKVRVGEKTRPGPAGDG